MRGAGSFVWVNQGACVMLGYTREELLALDIFAVDADVTAAFWKSNWSELSTLESFTLERQHRRRDGSLLPVEVNICHLDVRGEAAHFSFVRDLTGQKSAEELQRSYTQYMTALFENSPMPQLIINPDNMQIIDANSAAETFYGHEPLKGQSMSTINTLSAGEIRLEMKAASQRKRQFFRFRHRLASGEIRDVHVYAGPIEHDGRCLLHSSIEDMTQIYAFQRELEGYRDQLGLPIGVYTSTPSAAGIITSANNAMCEILEVESRAELLGRQASDFHPNASARKQLSEQVLEIGELRKVECELVTAKGRRIWASLSVRRIETTDGNVFFEGALQDITDKERAEQERETAFARLHNALYAAPIPIMLHRADGAVEEVNTAWCRLSGYRKEDLTTVDDWTRLAYRERAPAVQGHIQRLQNESGAVEEGDYTIHCKDGSTRIWAFYSSALESPERPDGLLISMAIDVTEEREKQQQARQAEAIVQSAAEGITVTGPDRNIQRVNPAFTRITGYTMAEVIGKNPNVLSSGRQNPAFYQRMWHQIDQLGHWHEDLESAQERRGLPGVAVDIGDSRYEGRADQLCSRFYRFDGAEAVSVKPAESTAFRPADRPPQ